MPWTALPPYRFWATSRASRPMHFARPILPALADTARSSFRCSKGALFCVGGSRCPAPLVTVAGARLPAHGAQAKSMMCVRVNNDCARDRLSRRFARARGAGASGGDQGECALARLPARSLSPSLPLSVSRPLHLSRARALARLPHGAQAHARARADAVS